MKRSILFCILITGFNVVALFAQAPKKVNHPALAMDNSAVDALLAAVKNQATNEAKLSVVKSGIQNNTDGITTTQELKLMNQFGDDNSKLEFAKFLYPWCVDYKNYDKIMYNMGSPVAQKTLKAFVTKAGSK